MLEQLISGAKDGILRELTQRLGLSSDQAQGFLQKGLSLLENALQGGKVDLASLTNGTPSTLLSKLDTGSLSGLVGGDATKARSGMETILAPLMNPIQNDSAGAQQLLGQFSGSEAKSGILDRVAGLAGQLLGKH